MKLVYPSEPLPFQQMIIKTYFVPGFMEKRKQPAHLFGFWGDRHIPEPSRAEAGIRWGSKEASVPACVGLQKFNAGRGSG